MRVTANHCALVCLILASVFLSGQTRPHWRANGGVLPGWIVGTAGAHRYALPTPNPAPVAKTNVYGYLLATVDPAAASPGTIQFQFKELKQEDVPQLVVGAYSEQFVHWCFVDNTDVKSKAPSPEE